MLMTCIMAGATLSLSSVTLASPTRQIWIDSRGSIDGGMLKILVLCVLWFARKLVYRRTDGRTDGHGDNISVFFPMRKKALKMDSICTQMFPKALAAGALPQIPQ